MGKIYLKRVREKSLCTQANGNPCCFYDTEGVRGDRCTKPEWVLCTGDYAGTCFRLATKREIAAWERRHP